MSDEQQQTQRANVRRSRRSEETVSSPPGSNGAVFVAAQGDLEQIDDIISGIVTPPTGQPSVALGEDRPQSVDNQLTNEARVRQFRQQGGQ